MIPAFWCALLVAQTTPEPAKLTIAGDVSPSVTLTAEDFAKMPRETVSVQDQDGSQISYEGVPLAEILKKAGVSFGHDMRGKALAGYLLASAKDGYQVVFSLGELDPGLGGARVIVADKHDGKALFGYQGPLRLVVATDKAPARSIRMLEKLEIVKLRR